MRWRYLGRQPLSLMVERRLRIEALMASSDWRLRRSRQPSACRQAPQETGDITAHASGRRRYLFLSRQSPMPISPKIEALWNVALAFVVALTTTAVVQAHAHHVRSSTE